MFSYKTLLRLQLKIHMGLRGRISSLWNNLPAILRARHFLVTLHSRLGCFPYFNLHSRLPALPASEEIFFTLPFHEHTQEFCLCWGSSAFFLPRWGSWKAALSFPIAERMNIHTGLPKDSYAASVTPRNGHCPWSWKSIREQINALCLQQGGVKIWAEVAKLSHGFCCSRRPSCIRSWLLIHVLLVQGTKCKPGISPEGFPQGQQPYKGWAPQLAKE